MLICSGKRKKAGIGPAKNSVLWGCTGGRKSFQLCWKERSLCHLLSHGFRWRSRAFLTEGKKSRVQRNPNNFTVAMQKTGVSLPVRGSRPCSKALNINELLMDMISQQLLSSDEADLAQRLETWENQVRKNAFSKTCTKVTKMKTKDDFEAFLATLECITSVVE